MTRPIAPSAPDPFANLLNKRACAALLKVDVNTLDNWRRKRKGPPEIHLGQRILFDRDRVTEWLLAGGTSLTRDEFTAS